MSLSLAKAKSRLTPKTLSLFSGSFRSFRKEYKLNITTMIEILSALFYQVPKSFDPDNIWYKKSNLNSTIIRQDDATAQCHEFRKIYCMDSINCRRELARAHRPDVSYIHYRVSLQIEYLQRHGINPTQSMFACSFNDIKIGVADKRYLNNNEVEPKDLYSVQISSTHCHYGAADKLVYGWYQPQDTTRILQSQDVVSVDIFFLHDGNVPIIQFSRRPRDTNQDIPLLGFLGDEHHILRLYISSNSALSKCSIINSQYNMHFK